MSEAEMRFNELPVSIPVFPLSGVLLLPRTTLPLNIFEPRYRNMTQDAMASDRLIGIVQPVDPEEVPVTSDGRVKNLDDEKLVLYSTGCVGQISRCQESPDGRYFISLVGVCRFRLGDEIDTTRGYRRFNAEWNDFKNDPKKPTVSIDRKRLLPAMRRYFEVNQIEVDWSAVDEADDESLVSALTMSSPFTSAEKQALLEANDLVQRCGVLSAIAEMAVHSYSGSPERPQ
tara:strand:- start:419 stop:1108 length:690 start_codon:yes stop_codon:yes gene_type:complete